MKSTSSFLAGFAAWFLVFFLVDGLGSVFDELLKLGGYANSIVGHIRSAIALLVALWAIPVFLAVSLTPRLKKRYLLPAAFFALWASFGGCFPLYLFIFPGTNILIAGIQALIGLAAVISWRISHTPLWTEERPAFSWWNVFGGVAVSALLFAMMIGSLLGSAAQSVETSTGGYVALRPTGLYLTEKTFRKGDKEIRLVGMIHIARSAFYDSVTKDMKGKPAIVLLEGVSDEKGLLKKRFSYNRIADFMGIASQEKSSFMSDAMDGLDEYPSSKGDVEEENYTEDGVHYRQADLDISAFQPGTLLLVEALGTLLSSQSWQEALQHIGDKTSPLNNEKAVKDAMADLIGTRNQHLLGSLQTSLGQSNLVIVPWGAMHLADVQKELEKMGFQEVGSKARQALRFIPSGAGTP